MEIKSGDVVFHRASNGWVVNLIEETEEGEPQVVEVVCEDFAGGLGMEQSLATALWEAFNGYYQSKWKGGLIVTVAEKGKGEEG